VSVNEDRTYGVCLFRHRAISTPVPVAPGPVTPGAEPPPYHLPDTAMPSGQGPSPSARTGGCTLTLTRRRAGTT
jgi:hypothetical protein